MATTAIWSIKGYVGSIIKYTANPEKTANKDCEQMAALHAVADVLQYTANDMKTEKRFYVSGVNCDNDAELATRQFIKTKNVWKKTNGIACFHAYQSFAPGEVSAELAHSIGIELAKKLWGERFEVLVSTHLNTHAFHNHFVINSVSFVDGMKYYDTKASYKLMRTESDKLCIDHGLSTIREVSNNRNITIGEIKSNEEGRYTAREQIRRDIDVAISQNISWKYFLRTLEGMGYILEYRGAFLRIKMREGKRFFRVDRLGEGYSEDELRKIIEENYAKLSVKKIPLNDVDKKDKPHGLYALYLYYEYLVGNLPKSRPKNQEAYYAIREDVKRSRMYSEEAKMLGKYSINTISELETLLESSQVEYEQLCEQRQKMYNKLRHIKELDRADQMKSCIAEVSRQLRLVRTRIKYCEDIYARSQDVQTVVDSIYKDEDKDRNYALKERKGEKTK